MINLPNFWDMNLWFWKPNEHATMCHLRYTPFKSPLPTHVFEVLSMRRTSWTFVLMGNWQKDDQFVLHKTENTWIKARLKNKTLSEKNNLIQYEKFPYWWAYTWVRTKLFNWFSIKWKMRDNITKCFRIATMERTNKLGGLTLTERPSMISGHQWWM